MGNCLSSPWRFSPPAIARLAPSTRLPSRSGGLWPEVTPLEQKPQRRPHSSATRRRHHRATRKPHAEICTVGEVTVSCMPRSFAPVMFSGLNQRTRSAYMICSALSSPEPSCRTLFRHPPGGRRFAAEWIPEHVRGDGCAFPALGAAA